MFISLLCPALALSGCQPTRPAPALATAQKLRAETLATQMADQWQAAQKEEQYHAAATAQAVQELVATLNEQPANVLEPFDGNSAGWPEGEADDPLALVDRKVAAGVYRWEATAKEGFVWWVDTEMDPVENFYASVEVEQVSGAEDGEAGLVFRLTEDEEYYLFEAGHNQTYSLYLSYHDEWHSLIDWTDSSALKAGGLNRLAVLARGDHFILFINDAEVAEITDDTLANGKIALVVGLSSAGDQGAWQFDNLRLNVLQGSAPP